MAECMGLHRDGQTYGMNPLETHVRRLVWYQLCFLDIRTCEAQGPRPTIRRDEFDTKLPLNVNDIDLHATGKAPTAADHWTDATFCLMRFEINEMMRTIVSMPFHCSNLARTVKPAMLGFHCTVPRFIILVHIRLLIVTREQVLTPFSGSIGHESRDEK